MSMAQNESTHGPRRVRGQSLHLRFYDVNNCELYPHDPHVVYGDLTVDLLHEATAPLVGCSFRGRWRHGYGARVDGKITAQTQAEQAEC